MKRMLLGNEALSLGAYMAGVSVATGYPGTPSTEILEYFANYPGVYAEWSPNEKVAMEVGIGAAMAGARTIVTMKHVGLNVAADPFFAVAYTGTEAGLVVISADDPGMHSSQGEQDNRNYAKFAKVPLLEPADSQECADMMPRRAGDQRAVRYAGARCGRRHACPTPSRWWRWTPSGFSGQTHGRRSLSTEIPAKYVMLPSNARQRRLALEERLGRLQEYVETTPLNYVIWGDRRLGIVTSSIATVYAREVFPTASFLKLGMAYPLPRRLILDFARQVDTLLIVEELDPYLEEQIRGASRVAADPNSLRRDCARARQGGPAGHRRVHARAGGQVRAGLRRAARRVRVRGVRLQAGGTCAAIRYPAAPAAAVPRLRPSRHLLHAAAAHVPGAGGRAGRGRAGEGGSGRGARRSDTGAQSICPREPGAAQAIRAWW